MSILKSIDPDKYHIVVISPTNYFLFTPLLPSATVGTLEPRYYPLKPGLTRSLVEPIRKLLCRCRAHYIEASAQDIDMSNKLILVGQTDQNGNTAQFYLPYDKVVISVGSTTNTHGVDGLEYVHFLKTIVDARNIRNHIMDNFEIACLPTTTDEGRRRLLSFVVAGGGPTGVEFASELFDMMQEDLTPYVNNPPPKVQPAYKLVPYPVKKRSVSTHNPISITYPQHIRPKN